MNINLLHLSSRKAVEAALKMAEAFPHIAFRREVTIGHLVLDYDSPAAALAKVNPPIRSREDVEYLWATLLDGKIDWVCSDHACCQHEMKVDGQQLRRDLPRQVRFRRHRVSAASVAHRGRKRGLSLNRVAELTGLNPARRFGLPSKGDLAPGRDADIVLVDPDRSFVVRAEDSESTQGYTPFEGLELTATVTSTYLRGRLIYDNGKVIGAPSGKYLKRPC